MADLNALIARGYQFQPEPDPFAQYAQMQQLDQNRQANQLNRMNMEKAQRDMEVTSSLNKFLPGLNESNRSQLLGYGPAGQSIFKTMAEGDKERRLGEQATSQTALHKSNILKNVIAQTRDAVAGIDPTDAPRYMALRERVLGQYPELAPHMPAEWNATAKQSLIVTAASVLEGQKPSAEQPDVAAMKALGYPLTQEGYKAFREAQRQARLLSPKEEAQEIRLAVAKRAPAPPRAEAAPTITQIVDPTNPNQMIAIDAKSYKGGGAGAAGVIGVSGKEPSVALRTNKVETGKTQLADDLDNLRASFQALDEMRSIPSTERSSVSNVLSGISATGIGQKTGQLFGTEAQVERDVINSARSRLVNSIKNATGMSAQQLNSNVELQTMLKSISDPGYSIQAAMRIIDDIENAYVKGNGALPKRSDAPSKPAPGKPSASAIARGAPAAAAGVAPPPGFKLD